MTTAPRAIPSFAGRMGSWSRSGLTRCLWKRLRAVCPCSRLRRAMCPHGANRRASQGVQTGRSTSLGLQGQDGASLRSSRSRRASLCAKPAPQRASTPTAILWASPKPLFDLPKATGKHLTPVAERFRGSFSIASAGFALHLGLLLRGDTVCSILQSEFRFLRCSFRV